MTAFPYTTPDRLVSDFVTRGLVVLGPDDLGIPADVHRRVYEKQFVAFREQRYGDTSTIPEVLQVLDSPGLAAACDKLLGRNWAIVPFAGGGFGGGGGYDQHWHKDDNGHANARKQRHHQAVQAEILYYPGDVAEDMGPTATIPYSQYWTFNHEENQDNFAGPDHMDFGFMIGGWHSGGGPTEGEPVSGPDSKYDVDDIVHRRTPHDVRLREAVSNTGWPLVRPFEAAPLKAGSILLYSHNTFHRGNHRRDDWRTWQDNPRFAWRFWLYRTTDGDEAPEAVEDVDWTALGVDEMTGVDRSQAGEDVTELWRYHHHWVRTGRTAPPRGVAPPQREAEAERLFRQLFAKDDPGEHLRIGAAYRLASIGDPALAARLLGRALYVERESVRRAATYGLIALGRDATETFIEATRSPVKWVRKAGSHGLGDASPLTEDVIAALVERLESDESVYVRHAAAGSLGCLGRRAVGSGEGLHLVPRCAGALVGSLAREENRPCMVRTQGRSIKFVRPTDESDICEGAGLEMGNGRFKPVRSAVRENALWSMVILCSHGPAVLGDALEPAIAAMREVIRTDENVVCVGYAADALTRLANLGPEGADVPPAIAELRSNLPSVLGRLPAQSAEALIRGRLRDADLAKVSALA